MGAFRRKYCKLSWPFTDCIGGFVSTMELCSLDTNFKWTPIHIHCITDSFVCPDKNPSNIAISYMDNRHFSVSQALLFRFFNIINKTMPAVFFLRACLIQTIMECPLCVLLCPLYGFHCTLLSQVVYIVHVQL